MTLTIQYHKKQQMRIIKLFLFVNIYLLAMACSKKDGNPSTPSTPVDAPVSGEVILYDEATQAVDKSGMKVSVDSTFPPSSSVTEANGRFYIPFIAFGKKTLVFEKAGYGTYKMFNISHANNNGAGTVLTTIPSLGKLSSTAITGLTATVSSGIVTVSATSNPGGNNSSPKYIRLFLNARPAVSNTNYEKVFDAFVARINPFEKTFTKAELNAWGFSSGTTVYVRAYGDSFWSNSYDDPVIGRTIFPNLNISAVAAASFIVP
jgi:hypothetical protein